MLWFTVGIIAFVTTLVGFMICLALWTYEDAKVKSQQSPLLWVLVVLLVPNLIGLIIYLLVGRVNKHTPEPRTYKRLVIFSALLFVLGLGTFVGGAVHFANAERFGAYGAQQIGSFAGYEDNLRSGVWTITANRANGYSRRTPVLDEAELDAFYVTCSGSGSINLTLEQGQHSQTIDISGGFEGYINLQRFTTERITITVVFDQAEEVDVTIRWR